MDEKLKARIFSLAQKYETPDFLTADPAQFMHRYSDVRDAETAAFIASALAFGRREQILSHVERILSAAGKSPAQWVLSGDWERFFDSGEKSFYRMFSHNDMRIFFASLRSILRSSQDGTFGSFFRERQKALGGLLHIAVASAFSADCRIVPHGKGSAAKKINMLLRWFVRQNSCVDLGIWDWASADCLLMPLDTHVMAQATELNLIEKSVSGKVRAADLKTAILPKDPVRADFALFGLGVEKSQEKISL